MRWRPIILVLEDTPKRVQLLREWLRQQQQDVRVLCVDTVRNFCRAQDILRIYPERVAVVILDHDLGLSPTCLALPNAETRDWRTDPDGHTGVHAAMAYDLRAPVLVWSEAPPEELQTMLKLLDSDLVLHIPFSKLQPQFLPIDNMLRLREVVYGHGRT